MSIKAMHEQLNKFRRFYAEARQHLSWCNRNGGDRGNALQYCRATRHELLKTMLELKIALAVRDARRHQP